MRTKKRILVTLAATLIIAIVPSIALAAYEIPPVSGEIVIDGSVSAEEWGEPQENYWFVKGWDSGTDEYETWAYSMEYGTEGAFEAYLRYDADYLYLAVTCHDIEPGNPLTAADVAHAESTDYWKHACAWIGIAMYDDVVANPQTKTFIAGEESRNVWTKLYFSLLDDGTQAFHHDIVKGFWCTEYDAVQFPTLTADDYAIVYNAPDLTYEARIPWNVITDRTDVGAGDVIVTSVVVKEPLQPNAESGNTLMWGMGVCLDDMMTGGVSGKLMGPKEEPTPEPTEEPVAEPTEEPVAETAEEPVAETAEEAAEPTEAPVAEPETKAAGSSSNTLLYVILGVLGVAILVVLVFLFKGGKKKDAAKKEDQDK